MKNLIATEQEEMEKDMMKYTDEVINNASIGVSRKVDTEEEAIALVEKTKPGEYISVVNQNNLGEVFIYQRNEVCGEVKKEGVWDGTSIDTSWYIEGEKVLHIHTGAELKGFAQLVTEGITFEGVEIQLQANIDLDYHPWVPIGCPYGVKEIKEELQPYRKYTVEPSPCSFRGIFNGNGHVIYNLSITDKEVETGCAGFFLSIQYAEVNNVTFADARLASNRSEVSLAIVAGVADNSIFTNILTSGRVICAKPSGICGLARDTAFYSCRNAANLFAMSTTIAGIVAGGICQQITLSKRMINSLEEKAPKLFMNCVNEGSIVASGKHAKYLWAGNFFGGTYYEVDVDSFSFIIDRCTVRYGTDIVVEHSDDVKGESVFFGYRNDYSGGRMNNVAETSKDDLMDGLIGRVDQYVGIEVKKLTRSTVVNNLVVPGSVNTLASGVGYNTFHTLNVSRATLEESVYDLEPFFRFVKVAKK